MGSPKNRPCELRAQCALSFCCDSAPERGFPTQTMRRGDVRFFSKDKRPSVYVVKSGLCAAMNFEESGAPLVFGVIGRLHTVGESEALFDRRPEHVLMALDDTELCTISTGLVARCVDEDPGKTREIMRATESNEQAFGRHLWVMNARTVYQRIRRLLYVLSIANGGPGNGGSVPVSHESVALMLNVNRPAVSRDLKRLEREGLVSLGYGSIEITGELVAESVPASISFKPGEVSGNASNRGCSK